MKIIKDEYVINGQRCTTSFYLCPSCNHAFGNLATVQKKKYDTYKFCPYCGKPLNWKTST